MSPDEIAALADLMVSHRLAEITVGDVTLKKTIHLAEQEPARDRATERPIQTNPIDEEPGDEEVLFHSSYERRLTVEDVTPERKPTDA